jgi:hypothetical protein
MADRRSLVEGVKPPPPPVDPRREEEFLRAAKSTATPTATPPTPKSPHARVPITTRMRTEYADALKRASLQRQLEGVEPNTLQDILEQAIEPWLRSNGYIR